MHIEIKKNSNNSEDIVFKSMTKGNIAALFHALLRYRTLSDTGNRLFLLFEEASLKATSSKQLSDNLVSRIKAYLGPLDTTYEKDSIHVLFHSNASLLAENIPTTEVLILNGTYKVRNYGLQTLDEMATVARAADLILELGLKPL
jgi:hypothetical protein